MKGLELCLCGSTSGEFYAVEVYKELDLRGKLL